MQPNRYFIAAALLCSISLSACDSGSKKNADPAGDNEDVVSDPAGPKTRYALANSCWAVRANGNAQYLMREGDVFTASAATLDMAEPMYLKPSALGTYLLHDTGGALLNLTGGNLSRVSRTNASPAAEFELRVVGDVTNYPATPVYHTEPTPEQVSRWSTFADPEITGTEFTLASLAGGDVLGVNDSGQLAAVGAVSEPAASFSFEPVEGCAEFPEASSDFSGTPFKGTQPDGTVLGHADAHIHISATEFLGGAEWGRPFHPYGVEYALGNCAVDHGDFGEQDFLGAAYAGQFGHATDGWPTFSDWPSRGSLTHEALYWKWLERAWAGGLRVAVNDLVDNETLCELERNVTNDPSYDCDPMNNAGRQAGTMYQMENYIDAQYGGPGKGFFQIVHSADEARQIIEDGKVAVVLGIEISNLFNCQLTYSPLRTQAPFEEDGSGGIENSYGCTTEEGLPNSILTQMQRVWDWGVRQIISIHEFDNAFGGNGIFDMALLNVGNRENSGGIPGAEVQLLSEALFNGDPNAGAAFVAAIPETETPTGEFWNTYDCPIEDETPGFSGYLWGSSGGASAATSPLMVSCPPLNLTGTGGGALYCYPADTNQCNARWMTPAGLYTYSKMMELGFIFDFDHMEMGMKTQALELSEAQTIPYPLVSTHGTFGGTTVDQARRVLAGGGFLYPSNGSSRGFREDLAETLGLHAEAMANGEDEILFGFGYGTDTNGLSSQSSPRGDIASGDAITYPFTFYAGGPWDALEAFNEVDPVVFEQSVSRDDAGDIARSWHQDIEGTSHGGMVTDWLQEIAIEGSAEDLKHIFNSAERFLQTWAQTEQSSALIKAEGLQLPAASILRPAPPVGDFAP